MQAFISKYGLAAHLALVAVSPLFLFPYCAEGTVASVLLWLSALGFVWLLMEPSRRADEMLHEARLRVRRDLLRDPLAWAFVLIIAIAAVRAVNGGVAVAYDEAADRDMLSGPWCPFLPGHAADGGFLPFAAAVAAAVVVEGCRLALGKSARISFAAVFGVFAGAAGVSSAVMCFNGSEQVISSLGFAGGVAGVAAADPAMASSAGNGFGLAFLASIAAAAGIFECRWHRQLLLFSFAIGGTLVGLFLFATPFQLVVYLALGIVMFAGGLVYVGVTLAPVDVLKYAAAAFIASVVPLTVFAFFMDGAVADARAEVLADMASFPANLFPEGFWDRRAALSEISFHSWRGAVWMGGGIGSFPLAASLARSAPGVSGASAPLNGWWGLLMERGILGAAAFAVPLGFILFTGVRRAVGALGRPVFLPLVALGILGTVAVAADAFFSSSILRADAILPAAAFLTLAASAFPARRKPDAGQPAGPVAAKLT